MADLKILDVGCGDGSIGVWVCEQLKAQGHEPSYVGVDLDEKMAEAAAQRLMDSNIGGYTSAAPAEEAPGSGYDAILAFELIEHVTDPDLFLQAMESRLAPGGRIYLSTPNGTFGLGGNPHHLRVYDLEGLIDLLRRRGQVHDGLAGGDGVAVAAYSPDPRRGEVALYLGGGWERWSPLDILGRGLGGSETAAVRLAEALAGRGYVVTVYGDVHRCVWGEHGILFEHHSTFDRERPRDAVIASRLPEIADRPVNADRLVLWMHDVDCGGRLTRDRAERFDAIVGLSTWHLGHLRAAYPDLPAGKLVQARNGIAPGLFEHPAAWQDRPHRAVYSSSPDRGLDFLLGLWPKVRERVPDAELVCTYAPVYGAVADAEPRIAAFRSQLAGMAEQPGVTWKQAGMGQAELATLLATSRLWLAPSWAMPQDQPFMETYCIGAVEAAAAGCWRVGSAWGALRERGLERMIGHEITETESDARGPAVFTDWWVDAICSGLRRGQGPPAKARKHALAQTWDGVGDLFAGLIEGVAR